MNWRDQLEVTEQGWVFFRDPDVTRSMAPGQQGLPPCSGGPVPGGGGRVVCGGQWTFGQTGVTNAQTTIDLETCQVYWY